MFKLAFALQYLGQMTERWYFFADARHPQNLYYQTVLMHAFVFRLSQRNFIVLLSIFLLLAAFPLDSLATEAVSTESFPMPWCGWAGMLNYGDFANLSSIA